MHLPKSDPPRISPDVTVFSPSDYLLGEFEQLCGQLASMTIGALRHLTGPNDPVRLLEFRLLVAVRDNEPATRQRLASLLPVDKTRVTPMLERLVDRDLIRRSGQDEAEAFSISAFGKTLIDQVNRERQRWLKPALRRLNAWERSTLIGAMRFLIGSYPKATASDLSGEEEA